MIDPESVVQARRTLGRHLAAYRRAAGLSQHELAESLYYGRSSIANVETGRQNVSREFWQQCDELTAADGALVRAYDKLKALIVQELTRPLPTGQTPYGPLNDAGPDLRLSADAPSPPRDLPEVRATQPCPTVSQNAGLRSRPHQTAGETWPESVDGRDSEPGVEPCPLVAPPGPALLDDLGHAVAQETQLAASFTRLVTESSVEPIAIDQLSADVRRLARSFISKPLVELFGEIRHLRRDVTASIVRNKYPDQLRELHLVGSRLSGLSAHLCLDLGDYASADTHARAAWLSAELSGHSEMRAWVRALQSLVAYWDGRIYDAVESAKDGVRYANDGTVVVRLFSLLARAHARRRDYAEALDALDAACEARARLVHHDDIGGLFTFPEAKQAAYAGTTLLTLDQPALVRRAAHESGRALALYQESAPPDRSVGDMLAARLDLTVAHIADGSLDHAEAELAHVLVTPAAQRTASVIRRSLAIGAALARPRFVCSPQATRIRDGIAAFTASRPKIITSGVCG